MSDGILKTFQIILIEFQKQKVYALRVRVLFAIGRKMQQKTSLSNSNVKCIALSKNIEEGGGGEIMLKTIKQYHKNE